MAAPSERKLLATAALTVLTLVSVQLWRGENPKLARPRVYASKVENLLAERDWDRAAAVAWAKIMTNSLENRAHFYYSRAMLERGFPSVALEHLVLAATPVATAKHLQQSAPPSASEVSKLLVELEERQPEYMSTATARLRVLRIAAASSDWARWRTLRQTFLTQSPAAQDAVEGLDIDLWVFFAHLTGAPPTDPEPVAGPEAIRRLLLETAGMKTTPLQAFAVDTPSPIGSIGILASGVFSGNRHLLLLGEEAYSFEVKSSWLFVTIDPNTAKILDEIRLSLTPLTEERTVLTTWLAEQPHDMLVAGCVSGEVLHLISPEGRTVLGEVFGLNHLPERGSLRAFTFLAYGSKGQMVTVEAAAIGADLPAILAVVP